MVDAVIIILDSVLIITCVITLATLIDPSITKRIKAMCHRWKPWIDRLPASEQPAPAQNDTMSQGPTVTITPNELMDRRAEMFARQHTVRVLLMDDAYYWCLVWRGTKPLDMDNLIRNALPYTPEAQ